MALQYELYKNQLGTSPRGYHARVVNQNIHNRERLIEMMVNRGTALTKGDIEAALTCFDEVMTELIKNGEGVNTGAFSVHLDIKGSFPDANSHFNPNDNKLAININATKLLKDLLGEVEVQKVYSSGNESKISTVEDTNTKTTNQYLSPDGPVKVFGHRIKIMPSIPVDNKEGLYAIALNDGTATKFPTEISNKPSELIYLAPSLQSGSYKLEVRTYANSSTKSGKTLKTVASDIVLTVR